MHFKLRGFGAGQIFFGVKYHFEEIYNRLFLWIASRQALHSRRPKNSAPNFDHQSC